MNIVIIVLFIMVWVLSGLFVAFLMRIVDDSEGENYQGLCWIKNKGNFATLHLVIIGPFALILGIIAMSEYCSRK